MVAENPAEALRVVTRAAAVNKNIREETLAALTWGASHVDAVEMVGTVVDLCKGPYSGFTEISSTTLK